MSSLNEEQTSFVKQCISRLSRGKPIRAACIYGSRVAGYSRPGSDIDILVVLSNYPFTLKYAYFRSKQIDVSALVVDEKALLRDAQRAILGEFVVGRLLHIYEPLSGASFIQQVERIYKKRVILEEISDIIAAAGVLGTEVYFPLAYIHFAKIKKRAAQYPGAAYSYHKTYSQPNEKNLQFALRGYEAALADIISADPELLKATPEGLLQISKARVEVNGEARLRLARRLSLPISSFIVHTYAGRKLFHLMISEAESKIKRSVSDHPRMVKAISNPRNEFWRLPEGELIIDSPDWISEYAQRIGINDFTIKQERLGNINSQTVVYTITNGAQRKLVAKYYARRKSVKWAALSIWTSPVRTFRVDPLLRLGSEYIANRELRRLGLWSPEIEAVVLDKRILVTRLVAGLSLSEEIKSVYKGTSKGEHLRAAGASISRIHSLGSSFGNIKPKNVIVNQQRLYFTDLEQFAATGGDQLWDIAQFICWGLKGLRNSQSAGMVVRSFLEGYRERTECRGNIGKLSRSNRHIESFYPILTPQVARTIKSEIRFNAS